MIRIEIDSKLKIEQNGETIRVANEDLLVRKILSLILSPQVEVIKEGQAKLMSIQDVAGQLGDAMGVER